LEVTLNTEASNISKKERRVIQILKNNGRYLDRSGLAECYLLKIEIDLKEFSQLVRDGLTFLFSWQDMGLLTSDLIKSARWERAVP